MEGPKPRRDLPFFRFTVDPFREAQSCVAGKSRPVKAGGETGDEWP
jgi:hypothetical protein